MVISDKNVAQASVIGAMLIDGDLIGPTLEMVRPDEFLDETLRRVFLTVRALFSEGKGVDLVTLAKALEADGSSGVPILKACMEVTPTTANHRAYIEAVRNESRLQRLNTLGVQLASAVSLDAAQAAVAAINEQMVERQRIKAVTMEQAFVNFLERQKTKREYLKWGFDALDRRIYAEPGNFIIIGARPNDGKTAFALCTSWVQAETNRVGFFSLETGDATLTDRMMARVAHIEMERIKRSELTEEDYRLVADHAKYITQHKLEIVPAAGMTADDIFAYAQARRYAIIYIDYLSIISGDERFGLVAKNSAISIALHTKAQATGITVVGLAQLSRPSKAEKKERPPTMASLRESGQYEQDADVVMMLYRPNPGNPEDGRRQLDVVKNKEGERGGFSLFFDGATQSFQRVVARVEPPARKGDRDQGRHPSLFDALPDVPVPFEPDGDTDQK